MMNKGLLFMSKAVSLILHPILMTFYSICLLNYYTSFYYLYKGGINTFLFPVFLLSILVPALGFLVLRSIGAIKTLNFELKSDRLKAILLYIISGICLVYFFLQVQVPFWYVSLLMVGSVVGFFALFISFFWKISIHLMALGSVLGSALVISLKIYAINSYALFVLLFLVSGILCSVRLVLGTNTPAQIYVGFLLGFLIGFGVIVLGFLFYL